MPPFERPEATIAGATQSKTMARAKRSGPRRAKSKSEDAPREEAAPDSCYVLRVPLSFIVGSTLTTMTFAFLVGFLCRRIILGNVSEVPKAPLISEVLRDPRDLPPPLYSENKKIPHTVYSAKQFDTAVATSDTLLARRKKTYGEPMEVKVSANGAVVSANGEVEVSPENVQEEEEEEEIHEPAGQHLLIDITGVDGVFLNTEGRLAKAMLELIDMSGLTMLSYHCHGLEPIGVSCVGVLLESHVSFHTWPIPGVIILDLFTCGSMPLLPLIPMIERLFGVPRRTAAPGDPVEKPFMQWAHKNRGFRSNASRNLEEETDLNQFMLGWMEFDMKDRVASVQTNFQLIEIYDIVSPRFRSLEALKKSRSNDVSYESLHPEHFLPDRIIYLDGIMQSRRYGEASYHEALVHPAMLAHANPKRVAIIGGGEGATLREVLKHNTVERVTMIEIDEQMVNVSRTFIPEWSDCSNIVGSKDSCFEDPRAEPLYTDAVGWFMDNFSEKSKIKESDHYDVIIMDAL
jgi:spermidine synthase